MLQSLWATYALAPGRCGGKLKSVFLNSYQGEISWTFPGYSCLFNIGSGNGLALSRKRIVRNKPSMSLHWHWSKHIKVNKPWIVCIKLGSGAYFICVTVLKPSIKSETTLLCSCSIWNIGNWIRMLMSCVEAWRKYNVSIFMTLINWCEIQFIGSLMSYLQARVAWLKWKPHFRKNYLTHWGLDKMKAIFQTTFSNAFSW